MTRRRPITVVVSMALLVLLPLASRGDDVLTTLGNIAKNAFGGYVVGKVIQKGVSQVGGSRYGRQGGEYYVAGGTALMAEAQHRRDLQGQRKAEQQVYEIGRQDGYAEAQSHGYTQPPQSYGFAPTYQPPYYGQPNVERSTRHYSDADNPYAKEYDKTVKVRYRDYNHQYSSTRHDYVYKDGYGNGASHTDTSVDQAWRGDYPGYHQAAAPSVTPPYVITPSSGYCGY